jgi:NAD-dependent SIR2 family protein deacetylase
MIHTEFRPELIDSLRARLRDAEYILIGAGAGLSADAGYDYLESVRFLERYPYLERVGVHCRYHSIGFQWPTKSMEWAFYARQLEEDLYSAPPHPAPYVHLRELTAHADRWVFTSNADDLFCRLGFDPNRIWTVQGTFSNLQCLRPCCEEVWDSRRYVERLLRCVDPASGELTDPSAVPLCPRCGRDMMLNVRGGSWFVEKTHAAQGEAFRGWLKKAVEGRLVVIEAGAGFNTPSVIRWPCEIITAKNRSAHLIRINPHHPKTQFPVGDRATLLAMGAAKVLAAIATTR